MRLMIRPVTVLLAFGLAVPVMAAETAPKPADANKQICKKTETTGTRLGVKRVCMTKGEWDLIADQSKEDLRRTIELGSAGTPR